MNRFILLYSLFFSFACVFADDVRNKSFHFLENPTSAYEAAMGGKNVALKDNGIQNIFTNPAWLLSNTDNEISVSYSRYLFTANMATAAYGKTWKENHFGVGLHFLDYGTFQGRDESNIKTSDFSAYDVAFYLSYARQIHPNVSLGATFKPIFGIYENYKSFALAVDFGAVYFSEKYQFNVALALLNMGGEIGFTDNTNDFLPFNIILSANKLFKHAPFQIHFTAHHLHKWDLTYDNYVVESASSKSKNVNFFDMLFRHTIWGVDFLPAKGKFRISASYNHQRSMELALSNSKSISGFSFGLGLNLKKIQIGVTAAEYQSGVWNIQLSLSSNINSFRNKQTQINSEK